MMAFIVTALILMQPPLRPPAHSVSPGVPVVPQNQRLEQQGVTAGTLGAALEQAGLLQALQPVLQALSVDPDQSLAMQNFMPAQTEPGDLLMLSTNQGIVLRVDRATGRVLQFRNEPAMRGARAQRAQLDQDAALQVANTLLATAGSSIQFAKANVLSPAFAEGMWRFHLPYEYQGVPCVGALRVWVAAATGRVLFWSDGPDCVPPASMAQKVERRKAVSLAERFVKSRYGKRGTKVGDSECELRIVHPNTAWDDKQSHIVRESAETRLCWVVRFPELTLERTPRPVTVYIDAGVGTVVGGIR